MCILTDSDTLHTLCTQKHRAQSAANQLLNDLLYQLTKRLLCLVRALNKLHDQQTIFLNDTRSYLAIIKVLEQFGNDLCVSIGFKGKSTTVLQNEANWAVHNHVKAALTAGK